MGAEWREGAVKRALMVLAEVGRAKLGESLESVVLAANPKAVSVVVPGFKKTNKLGPRSC